MEAKRFSWCVGVAFLLGTLAVPQAGWSVLGASEPLTPDELLTQLTQAAERIVLGTVVAKSSYCGDHRQRGPHREYRVVGLR